MKSVKALIGVIAVIAVLVSAAVIVCMKDKSTTLKIDE